MSTESFAQLIVRILGNNLLVQSSIATCSFDPKTVSALCISKASPHFLAQTSQTIYFRWDLSPFITLTSTADARSVQVSDKSQEQFHVHCYLQQQQQQQKNRTAADFVQCFSQVPFNDRQRASDFQPSLQPQNSFHHQS